MTYHTEQYTVSYLQRLARSVLGFILVLFSTAFLAGAVAGLVSAFIENNLVLGAFSALATLVCAFTAKGAVKFAYRSVRGRGARLIHSESGVIHDFVFLDPRTEELLIKFVQSIGLLLLAIVGMAGSLFAGKLVLGWLRNQPPWAAALVVLLVVAIVLLVVVVVLLARKRRPPYL